MAMAELAGPLLRIEPFVAENQRELALREAFRRFERRLRPPFPLTIPTPEEYQNLNRAILYGILTEPHNAQSHIKHLHALVSDGYAFFVNLLVHLVDELLESFVDSARSQLLWVAGVMVDVAAVGFDRLLVSLLRQIVGGDFTDGNLWLCFEMVTLFLTKWVCLLEEEPMVLSSGLYVFLRLIGDHCRVSSRNSKFEALVRLEIDFCLKVFRDEFHLCLKIGRDVIRLLQDLIHVPEFRAVWKDLILNPSEFRTPEFSGITQFYSSQTPSHYFLLRIPPVMETQLRFLLSQVKLGMQKRHQAWFAIKYLSSSERETLICDIVRFICCGHYPTKEILQSDIIPRWAVIGWLLKSCRKNYVEANVKLALFYDWLFFDERRDEVMNIEPALLLMVCSVPKYVEITNSLLEFLFLLMDNYDIEHKEIIRMGVLSSFSSLVSSGVTPNLEALTSSVLIFPSMRERLGTFLKGPKSDILKQLPSPSVPIQCPHALIIPDTSCPGTPTPPGEQPMAIDQSYVGSKSIDSTHPRTLLDELEDLVENLGEAIVKSDEAGLSVLQKILDLYVSIDNFPVSGPYSVQNLAIKIFRIFELAGHKLFASHQCSLDETYCWTKVDSFTSTIIRKFVFSRNERILEMLTRWSTDGLHVGECLLLYAFRLAYEANEVDNLDKSIASDGLSKLKDSQVPVLKFHLQGHQYASNSSNKKDLEAADSSFELDRESVGKLVDDVFIAYKCFLSHLITASHVDKTEKTLSELLLSDLITYTKQKCKNIKYLCQAIFSHLPDLCISKEGIIRLFIRCLDDGDILDVKFDIGLRRFSLFGVNTEAILNLLRTSLRWEPIEQYKLWDLLRVELTVSRIQLENLIVNFICASEMKDSTMCSIAVGSLLSICSSQVPTPELVGALILLPNHVLQDFASAVLSMWAHSNATKLFDSLAKFSEKHEASNGGSIFSSHDGIVVNNSAVLWLLKYFDAQGLDLSNILGSG